MDWTDFLDDEDLNVDVGMLLHNGSWHFMSCTEQMSAVFRKELAEHGYKIVKSDEGLNKED